MAVSAGLSEVVHLAAAYLLTLLLGWQTEREVHGAGVRTFPVVGMASCAYLSLLADSHDTASQSRLLQGLMTGIGFIGGGAILKQGVTVRGTATAASILNAAVIGASISMDRWATAIILVVLNLITLRALLPLKHRLDGDEEEKPIGAAPKEH